MEPLTSDQIAGSFVNCSKGRAQAIAIPDLSHVTWGQLDFFGWRNPRTPQRAWLAIWLDSEPVALELRYEQRSGTHTSRTAMCDFCLTVHSAGGVRLFAATRAGAAGKSGNSLGKYMCADLECSRYVRGLKKPVRVQPQTTATPDQRIARLTKTVTGFVGQVCGRGTRD